MAYRDIPKKIDWDEIAPELKTRLLYNEEIDSGVVIRIAKVMGCSKEKIYKTLDGDIPLDMDFLHAAVIGSNGDPEVRKYLEPKGYGLQPTDIPKPDKLTVPEECCDDTQASAALQKIVNDPDSTETQALIAMEHLFTEIRQTVKLRYRPETNGKNPH